MYLEKNNNKEINENREQKKENIYINYCDIERGKRETFKQENGREKIFLSQHKKM